MASETIRSAIHGTGHGDAHSWRYLGSYPWKASDYVCAVCGECFRHHYDDEPNIFAAMAGARVRSDCPDPPPAAGGE